MALLQTAYQPQERQRFSPYADNGGTVVAIAGADFAVIASDTRLCQGYAIQTRNQSKLFRLSDKTVLGAAGCWCDVLTLTRTLTARLQMYRYDHNKDMSTSAVGQLVSTLLYYKRFFPYYVANVLAGLDSEGKGVVYHYDPIGHIGKTSHHAGGASGALLQSILDNQIDYKNQANIKKEPISLERAVSVIKDVFISAAERETHTGDSIIINIIDKNGVREEKFELRKD